MKANKYIDKIEYLGQDILIKWVVWISYTIIVAVLCSIHEPWGDEHHVWSMVYRMSLPELWSSMRIEGHFMLWHLCVLPWVKLFDMDYHALFVTSTIIMSLGVWLMLFKLEFSFIGKLFIIFSAPFLYYFPVIARCYALIPPILIALAVVNQSKKHPYLFCFLIGLLAHTHAYMEGMVGIIWCLFVYDYVYIPYKRGEIQRAKRNGWASLVTVALVLLAFMQVMGGIADAASGTSVAMKRVSSPVGWILSVYEKHHIQITTTLHTHVSACIPNIDLAITLSLYVAITILSFLFIQKTNNKKGNVLIIGVTIIWQILFALNIYSMQFQRIYLLYMPILYVIWSGYNNINIKYSIWIVVCVWLLNTPAQYDILKDIKQEYCYDVTAAKHLKTSLPEGCHLLSYAEECSRLLKNEIMFLDERINNGETLDAILLNTYPNNSVLYLITSDNIDSVRHRGLQLPIEKICATIEGNNTFTGIGYERNIYLYKITR